MRTTQALVPKGQNRGINSSLRLQNNTIKRGEGLRRRKKKITTESLRKFYQEENSEKLVKLSPDILKTATIAHTRIQKESNFASLRGLNSHLRL